MNTEFLIIILSLLFISKKNNSSEQNSNTDKAVVVSAKTYIPHIQKYLKKNNLTNIKGAFKGTASEKQCTPGKRKSVSGPVRYKLNTNYSVSDLKPFLSSVKRIPQIKALKKKYSNKLNKGINYNTTHNTLGIAFKDPHLFQGQCGICWVDATCAILAMKYTNYTYLTTKKKVFYKINVNDIIKQTPKINCETGGYFIEMFNILKRKNLSIRANMYNKSGKLISTNKKLVNHISSGKWKKMHATLTSKITWNDIKLLLALSGPQFISINANAFQNSTSRIINGKEMIYNNTSSTKRVDHAVVLVGVFQSKGNLFAKIRNSWKTKTEFCVIVNSVRPSQIIYDLGALI